MRNWLSKGNAAPLKSRGRRVAMFWHSERPILGGVAVPCGYDKHGIQHYAFVKGQLMPRGTTLIGCLDNIPDNGLNFMNGHYVVSARWPDTPGKRKQRAKAK